MKKILLLFVAIMMVSTGLWAQDRKKVSYLYPVYNTEDVPASGIKEWETEEREAIILTGSDSQFTLSNQWYVITGDNVIYPKGLVCQGDVHLILADGAILMAMGVMAMGDENSAGIQVSGEGNSLTIYGQDKQTGQLLATSGTAAGIGGGSGGNGSNITINGGTVTANGDGGAAGIGGGAGESGSNITINGGTVTATSEADGAGIGGGRDGKGMYITINGGTVTATSRISGAGIGGGYCGSGSNIIINGGTITANGGMYASGIGGGDGGESDIVYVATDLIIKADGNNPPETGITNTGDDLAGSLAGKRYVNIEIDLNVLKNKAIGEINKAIDGVTDEDVRAIADKAITDISNATSEEDINSIKTQALKDIAFAISKIDAIAEILSASQGIKNAELNAWIDAAIADIKKGRQDATPTIDDIMDQILYMINLFQDGKAEGKADLLGSMATEQDGPAVEVIKGEKKVILYSPDKVNFIKVETEN